MSKSLVVGLTGQTGAGKSTAARYMEQLGCAVIDADMAARETVKKGSKCLLTLAREFGYDIIEDNGELNRRLLAQRAFSDPKKTEMLNSITHPFILEYVKKLVSEHEQAGANIIIFDAPQLFESGGNLMCQKIIAVTAPEAVRLERIKARDGLTKDEAYQRVRAQYDESFFTDRADYIIDGSQALDVIQRRVREIIEEIDPFCCKQR